MSNWVNKSIFYHIYPLGFCGAPKKNDFISEPKERLNDIYGWTDHLTGLGVNALYLGPVFESSTHGYDTSDYFTIDRRLGTNESFRNLSELLHRKGIKVVLDAVFNHVGRDFYGFKDLQVNLKNSGFKDWFQGVNFNKTSPFKDPFTYDTWNGYYSLVKLNLNNKEVQSYLFDAVTYWIDYFMIDGLRLDAADCLDFDFLRNLSQHCRQKRSDFFLLGEVIHGDYRRWVNKDMLDSVTNYESYKGLFSSHNDNNYFEIAFSLNRQFGHDGVYEGLPLYSFADNHDVNRLSSTLKKNAHLYPAYCLLFTMPGIPSVYYGSEWGISGEKKNGSDDYLRPALELQSTKENSPNKDLEKTIARLSEIRKNSGALQSGTYRQLFVNQNLFSFSRQTSGETVIVILNSSEKPQRVEINLPFESGILEDMLNPGENFTVSGKNTVIDPVYPNWSRILRFKN